MSCTQANHERRFYAVNDIMAIMNIGKNKAYEFIQEVYENQSPFPVIKIGSTYRIPKEKFDRFSEGGLGNSGN